MVDAQVQNTFADNFNTPESSVFKEAVGLFQNSQDLQDAIRDLEGSAFPRQDISVMGSENDLKTAFGSGTVNSREAMDDPNTPRQAPSRPEEQTIGAAAMVGIPAYVGAMGLALASGAVTFPAIIAAAAFGGLGGGTIGAVLTKLFGDNYTKHMEEQIERGGILLWVRTPDVDREELAMTIMHAHNGNNIHIQTMV